MVEGDCLESSRRRKSPVGSNPTLSAIITKKGDIMNTPKEVLKELRDRAQDYQNIGFNSMSLFLTRAADTIEALLKEKEEKERQESSNSSVT